VQTGENGNKYIYVVQSNGTAVMQPVTSSRTYEQLAVIDNGIKPGQTVVVDGQYRVIPNSKVDVVRTVPVVPKPKQVADNGNGAGDGQ
jgi:multidrug efflux system membrane fusion protein